VADLRFLGIGGVIIPFDTAVSQGLIRSALFMYNRRTMRYEQLNRNSLIPPGHAIWIFAFGERNVVWPPPQGPNLSITP
jgi:hypothetical protein